MELQQRDLESLLKLQELDLKIAEINKQSANIPQLKKECLTSLKVDKEAYQEIKSEIHASELKCKNIGIETDKVRGTKTKILIQSGETKDNATYTRLVEEASNCDKKIDELEIQSLMEMDVTAELREKQKKAAEQLKALLAKVEQDIHDLDKRKENFLASLPAIEKERAELSKTLDIDDLHHYDRVFKSKGGNRQVIVEVTHDDSCGFCHIKLSTKDLSGSQKHHTLASCGECGAFLYK